MVDSVLSSYINKMESEHSYVYFISFGCGQGTQIVSPKVRAKVEKGTLYQIMSFG